MKKADVKVLKRLDAVLWGLWLLAPLLIYNAVQLTWSLPFDLLNTSKDVAAVSTYSMQGQIVIGLTLAFHIAIYVAMYFLIHKLVRQFIKGEILISATLNTMKKLAYIFLSLPFVFLFLFNLNLYLLHQFGDLASWQPYFDFDIVVFAIGIMFLALHILIQHAVQLQKDVDLTI
jgi:Protein of unknown function (DUF2975)